MKKILTALTLCLFSVAICAQPGNNSNRMQRGHTPPPNRHVVNFESHSGEAFSVFIDGNLVNRMAQTRVMVNDVSSQTHEVVVVMRRPTEKAAVMQLRPGEPTVLVNVTYDQRLDQLSLYTPMHNRPDTEVEARMLQHREANNTTVVVVSPAAPMPPAQPGNPAVRPTSEEELQGMITRMRDQSFDSERLALGKVIVASANLTAAQVGRLAQTIDFTASQVEFLKYAYHYCIDPQNYYLTVDVLTFSSDKKKVLDYIATQR